MKYLTIKPKHWWEYLNPFWWRRKQTIEAVLNYQFEKRKSEVEKAFTDSVLYGTGKVGIKWDGDK